jgi:quinolinate synthase
MLLWNGSCIVHETFSERKLIGLQLEHPDAELIAHPECEDHILAKAGYIGSTSMLLKYVQQSTRQKFIVGTEYGIVHQMEKSTTGKTFLPLPPEENCACNECPHMKRNTLEKLYRCMKEMSPQIEMSADLLVRAKKPIDRMLAMS